MHLGRFVMIELIKSVLLINKQRFSYILSGFFPSILLVSLTFSQLSWAKNVFEVSGVDVDITAKTAAEARNEALADGKIRAFQILLKRLTLRNEHKSLPTLSHDQIDTFINDFSVSNEKTSPVRYLASLSIRFKSKAIRALLNEHALNFAETVSKPVLIIPVYQTAGALILWDDPNPWRDAWAAKVKNFGLVPTVLPLGDLADIASIGAEQTLDGDIQRINAIAKRYGASNAIVVFGALKLEVTEARRVLEVYFTRYGGKFREQTEVVNFFQEDNETVEALLLRSVIEMTHLIEDNWKRDNLMQFNNSGIIPVTISISNLKDWISILSRLKKVAVVGNSEIVLLSKKEVRLNLHFFGDTDQLALALEQADLRLYQIGGGEWALTSAFSVDSGVKKSQ